MRNYRIWTSKKEYIDVDAECPSRAVAFVGRRWVWKIERGDGMAVTEEIIKEACDLETLINWRGLMQYMTPIGCTYVNNEPRRYYKNRIGHYYYRRVTESEIHRFK